MSEQPPSSDDPQADSPEAPPPPPQADNPEAPPPAPESIQVSQPAPDQAAEASMAAPVNATRRSAEERRAIFAQQLQQAAARQLRVESTTEFQAVLIEGKPIN